MTSTDALALQSVPKSLIIVGSGVIGSEFACIFSTMGTQIVMIELMDRMLPTEDTRVSKQMRSTFRKEGIDIRTETTVKEVLELSLIHISEPTRLGMISYAVFCLKKKKTPKKKTRNMTRINKT